MPDTGAPWNIPYVTSTDLVSDWPADSLALANAIDAGLDAAENAGIGSNVVSTILDTTFTTSSTSFIDVTGLTCTITPSSASSKILVLASLSGAPAQSGGIELYALLARDGSPIAQAAGTGRIHSSFVIDKPAASGNMDSAAIQFLDSPGTTSAVTYSVQVRAWSGSVYVNRSEDDNFAGHARTVSTITAIEVAA